MQATVSKVGHTCSQRAITSTRPAYTAHWVPLLRVQLTEQVQRINSKLQASIATLSQDGSPAPSTAAAGIASPEKANAAAASRAKIDKMSAEVVDSNPYSRLMALQRMGIVKDYERIRTKTVSSSV
eukprot:GHUV01018957.1.p2 GENE.GHUV01018957.1~~GHUV01018957.1.p2  ORF type:complete len:126 (+),score=29.95 GHUV01018957.1:1161-1538(+)